ncbi:unnamed protein product [Eruca vesicaria subsp. sativa]|uniref:Uncharacterized protein n=1 Tax=Eruca vesicaria subsp. sativa TaxID=29727 RepID=A0ABC8LHL6_ERUVS|nr:unnamed protein product [Eruca vesicaria subsp. sativa]
MTRTHALVRMKAIVISGTSEVLQLREVEDKEVYKVEPSSCLSLAGKSETRYVLFLMEEDMQRKFAIPIGQILILLVSSYKIQLLLSLKWSLVSLNTNKAYELMCTLNTLFES